MKTMRHEQINTIGGVPVFTVDGAVDAYKRLAKVCYDNLTLESSSVLANEAQKLYDLGFTWDEIEALSLTRLNNGARIDGKKTE